jgi:hypothetical protein
MPPENPEEHVLTRAEFESQLIGLGFNPTEQYSLDGRSRLWRHPNNAPINVEIFDHYPAYIAEKFLVTHKVKYLPLYGSNLDID